MTSVFTKSPKRLALLSGLALVIALSLFWTQRRPQVEVISVQVKPLVSTLQLTARIAAASRVELGSTITGRVQHVLVREGDSFQQGQTLVRLESDELQATVAHARANEILAGARLTGLQSTGRSTVQAAVDQAQSVLVAAESDFQRQLSLLAQGFVSEGRVDEARRAVSVARAQLTAAQAQLSSSQAPAGSDAVQAEAQLAQARAGTAAAMARLAQATLAAPSAGRVLTRSVEPGQIVQPGRPLLSLALDSPTELVAALDERYLAQLRSGQTAQVMADAYPNQRFSATVQRIAPWVDAQRGSVEVRLSLKEPTPAFLREDLTLSVEIETGRREQAVAIPLSALRGDVIGGETQVWIVNAEDRIEARTLKLGLRTLEAAEVLQGLQVGDRVALGVAAQIGQRVSVSKLAHGLGASPRGARNSGGDATASAVGNATGR